MVIKPILLLSVLIASAVAIALVVPVALLGLFSSDQNSKHQLLWKLISLLNLIGLFYAVYTMISKTLAYELPFFIT